jgi:peptide/nickel transport system permease protein
MINYLIRRAFYAVLLLFIMSIVAFVLIQLPPGDYVSGYVAMLASRGLHVPPEKVEALRQHYGLNQPIMVQYFKWIGRFLQGDLGRSLQLEQPVADLIKERLALTLTVALLSLVVVYGVGTAIGIYSATHQYSAGDYVFTVLGFIGISMPGFLIALVLMFLFFKYFNANVGGLFSREFAVMPGWSWGKVVDLLKHLPLPIVIIGLAGASWLIRVMRGSLLDELRKQYVITARAKGQKEQTLLFRYPVRMALNPIISFIGWELTYSISAQTIVAIVMGLPTLGPLLFTALVNQDMYLAGAIVLLLGSLTIVGTFVSDILLALVDPRIRYTQ